MAIADVELAGADSSRSADIGDSGRDNAAMSEAPGGTTGVILMGLGSEQATMVIIEGWATDAGDRQEMEGNSRN